MNTGIGARVRPRGGGPRHCPGGQVRSGVWLVGGLAVAVLTLGACVYDPDDVCDPGQRDNGGFCVCEEGAVPAELGCAPCGEHSRAEGDACVCDEGFVTSADGTGCEAGVDGLGDSCDPDASDPGCADPFPFCQPSSHDGGYCTSTGCGSDDDCGGGYLCDDRMSPSVCTRPTIGLGDACTGDAECTGEADYCVVPMNAGCAISGCSVPDEGCPVGTICCDLSVFGLVALCAPEAECPL